MCWHGVMYHSKIFIIFPTYQGACPAAVSDLEVPCLYVCVCVCEKVSGMYTSGDREKKKRYKHTI